MTSSGKMTDLPSGKHLVYTCKCGREAEKDWMTEHLRLAHRLGPVRIKEWFSCMPKRFEYVRIREPPTGLDDGLGGEYKKWTYNRCTSWQSS